MTTKSDLRCYVAYKRHASPWVVLPGCQKVAFAAASTTVLVGSMHLTSLSHQTPILDYFVKFLWLILTPHDMLIYTNPQICKAPFTRHLIWVESWSDFLSSGLSKRPLCTNSELIGSYRLTLGTPTNMYNMHLSFVFIYSQLNRF